MPVTLQPTALKYRNNGENQWHEADVLKGTDISPAVADIEPTTTAIASHAIGNLFILNGKLYKTTSAIAIGDTIITSGSGANCEETTVTDEIPTVPVTDVQVNGVSVLNQGVANVPKASSDGLGVVKLAISSALRGIRIDDNGNLYIQAAALAQIKTAGSSHGYVPIVPTHQHESAFYGLAKAAGDTTQSSSSNAVGTYTETAKSKISEMLGSPVSVSGTTPTITALSGIQYVCGEVATLDITLPASGIVDVVFESGSTPTVLTVTPPTGMTVEWANGFDSTALEADTLYELNIKMVGTKCLGVAGAWS